MQLLGCFRLFCVVSRVLLVVYVVARVLVVVYVVARVLLQWSVLFLGC